MERVLLNSVLKDVSDDMQQNPAYKDVLFISTARVPVLKFSTHELQCDLILNKSLGVHNTQLLATYGKIDDRFTKLGYAVKHWAKGMHVNDASNSTLSSYALLNMLVHFLQRTTPAVLPFLQQLGEPVPDMHDGYDCYFYRNLDALPQVWPDYHQNTASCGELLLGFFRYFTETFDFEHHVVCTRREAALTKDEKDWARSPMAIEDPFELDHNLCKGVTKLTHPFIVRTLRTGRQHFAACAAPPQRLLDPLVFRPEGNCLLCEQPGHHEDKCDLLPRNMKCFKCNEMGHRSVDCPKQMACSVCNKTGHDANRCPLNRECYSCGQRGHQRNNCPQRRQVRQEPRQRRQMDYY
eukprot:m.74548 g.74548  ORF g.74548 m.74548 type:complete len:351 (-) comp17109_c0_seq4:30-1082(-)